MKKDTSKRAAGRRRPGRVAEPAPEPQPDELLPEYNPELIRQGVRGKYASRYAEGANVVVLDPDVAAAFPTAMSVNSALRALLEIAQRHPVGGAAGS